MHLKTLIASLIVSAILALIAFVIDLATLFPMAIAYFIVALLAGLITSHWVNATPASEEARRDRKSRKPARKPAAASGPKETGSVKWFSPSKGFGFITRDNGEDIFVHFRSIMGKGHRVLREGQRVEFAVTQGSKGLQAEEVNKIG